MQHIFVKPQIIPKPKLMYTREWRPFDQIHPKRQTTDAVVKFVVRLCSLWFWAVFVAGEKKAHAHKNDKIKRILLIPNFFVNGEANYVNHVTWPEKLRMKSFINSATEWSNDFHKTVQITSKRSWIFVLTRSEKFRKKMQNKKN